MLQGSGKRRRVPTVNMTISTIHHGKWLSRMDRRKPFHSVNRCFRKRQKSAHPNEKTKKIVISLAQLSWCYSNRAKSTVIGKEAYPGNNQSFLKTIRKLKHEPTQLIHFRKSSSVARSHRRGFQIFSCVSLVDPFLRKLSTEKLRKRGRFEDITPACVMSAFRKGEAQSLGQIVGAGGEGFLSHFFESKIREWPHRFEGVREKKGSPLRRGSGGGIVVVLFWHPCDIQAVKVQKEKSALVSS